MINIRIDERDAHLIHYGLHKARITIGGMKPLDEIDRDDLRRIRNLKRRITRMLSAPVVVEDVIL